MLVKHSKDLTHAYSVISRIVEEETDCPRPATLKAALLEGQTQEDTAWLEHRTCPLGLCVGDGWRVYYQLRTRQDNHTHKEFITKEQAAALNGKLDPKVQSVYEAVAPCECGGAGK